MNNNNPLMFDRRFYKRATAPDTARLRLRAQRDQVMAAILHYRQLDWLCRQCEASVDMVREFMEVGRELAELIAKARGSTWTKWPGCRARVWTASAAHPTGAVILDATESWALLNSEVPLQARTAAALEHHCLAPGATLQFHGDVAFTDHCTSLFVFDGPAMMT